MPCNFDPLEDCKKLCVFHLAVALFYAPSNYCGIGGMRTECICSTPNCHGEGPRCNCVFAKLDSESADNGFQGMTVLCVMLLFSFEFKGHVFLCALVEWFSPVGTGPHSDFGMWLVKADKNQRTCHLIPCFGSTIIPSSLLHVHSLSVFNVFWVNKFADYHAHKVAQ
ncbi:hypothetical protein BDV98DRAFT_517595 [Pterulicium gracile]|uniref:Uncharacterized protein n=1 Tax=Pterulicium gracile TaxID=1884261 RepID=A0A5C3Q2T3_9AGAR|nr:hypothetical protein BDV98DRAFT_517595 [Pterula gracilis]